MNSITASLITFVSISGVLSLLMGLYAASMKTPFTGKWSFIGVSVTATLYIFGFAMELASTTLAEIKLWAVVEYMGIALCPPFCLLLVMHYSAMEKWLRAKIKLALFLLPSITLVLIATNEWHHLFYRSIYWRADAPFPTTDVVMGDWYIVQGSYTFGCLMLAALILMRQWKRTPAYRKQLAAMLAGHLLPILAAFLYLVGLTPYGIDPVPFVLAITSACYIWAIRTTGMLDIAPIAREHIFDSMRDGVVVFDPFDRLADYNRAAARIVSALRPEHLGYRLDRLQAFEPPGSLLARLNPSDLEAGQRIRLEREGASFYYEVYASPVLNRAGRTVGRMLSLLDVTEAAVSEERLRYLATHDGLTQTYSRAYFLTQADGLFRDCASRGEPFCILLLDIDYFKQVNDRYGHFAGDRALVHVVGICERLLGEGNPFARYGGEEFVAALPGMELAAARRVAEAIRAELAASPLTHGGERIALTASLGLADGTEEGSTLTGLLHRADEALYQAKANGRNAVYPLVS